MTRDKSIYVSRPIYLALLAAARALREGGDDKACADSVAETALATWLDANAPAALNFYNQQKEAEDAMLKSLLTPA